MIYRLPRDPHQRASIFATEQTIVVNEGEIAVVLEDGRSQGALEPGRYVFQKARVTGSLDIVWIVTGQQTLKWGIGNVSSTDGIQLSANGVVYVRVEDGRLFNAEVVQGAMAVITGGAAPLPPGMMGAAPGAVDLQRFLMPRIQGVLRTVLAKWEAIELQRQREVFATSVKEALGDTLRAMGLAIVDFEVIEINFPPEFKAILSQATMATHAGRAQLVEAQTRAQMLQLEAAAQAQAHLLAGTAQVQVMAQLQAQGIDPLKLKALDALQTFAANPPQGGMMIGGDPARAALFGQLAAASLSPGVPVAAAPPAALPAAPAAQPLQPAAPVAVADGAGGQTVADLERQLDALTERLAEGKITEETYNKLSARLEAKLEQLRAG
jgi:regulator of protease activity HflC (stomatin/prohibitin superfamily)